MPNSKAQNQISLSLLGRFSLSSRAGADLMAGSPRQRALVAFLALQPSMSASREQLCGLLWTDADEHYARQNLRQIILRSRRELASLADDAIVADRDLVRLNRSSFTVDAREFERLAASNDPDDVRSAIELYGGDLLGGLALDAEGFSEWLGQESARLRVLFRAVVERYLAHPDVSGADAIAAANRIIAIDPFDERAQRLLLQTIARHYGPQAALTRADIFIQQLHKELGVEPDDETRALIAQIRANALQASQAAGAVKAPAGQTRFFENAPPRDLNFTGREPVLEMLHDHLDAAREPAMVRQVVIHGLGGIGKTSLAAEYAHRRANDYSGVWWARAAQRTLLVESLADLAGRLDPALAAEADHEKAAIAGLARLARFRKPFLLVYDNVDAPETIRDLIPSSGARVIITSRWADWSGRAAELRLDAFEEDVAVEFLQKRAGRNDPNGAQRLARALGRLPLALDHAGAYCKLTASSFASYLARIDVRIARAPKGVAYPASIAATFGLAVEAAAQQHNAAESLLGAFAFLSPEGIPLSLLAGAILGEDERDDALAALYVLSLVEHETLDDETMITLHPLVQSAMRVRLAERGEAAAMMTRVTTVLADAFPTSALTDPKTWQACAMLLRHVLALRDLAGWAPEAGEVSSRLLHSAASYLHVRGAYDEAEPLYREAIAIGQDALGADHPDIAQRQNSLALLLWTTGRYDEAEPLLRETIASGEKALGRHHIDVAMRLNNFARLLSDTKRYDEAEPLYREAIAIADEPEHRRHPYAVAWRNNFGILLNETGRNAEGEPLYREALAIGERTLGRRHHEVARCMNNLGRLLRDVGKFAEAEPLIRDALALWQDMLGDEHTLLARGQENLASVLLKLGRPEEALGTADRALRTHERALGGAHFWTRDSARTCALALDALGRADEARELRLRFNLSATAFAAE